MLKCHPNQMDLFDNLFDDNVEETSGDVLVETQEDIDQKFIESIISSSGEHLDESMNESTEDESQQNVIRRYHEFLERLKIEFGEFIRLAENGKTVRHSGLKARKKSIQLRNLLKEFRKISIENEHYITECVKRMKEQIIKESF